MRILINNCLVLSLAQREEISRRQPVTSQPAPGPQLCRETSLTRVWCYTLLMHFDLFKAPSFFPWEVFSRVMLGCSYHSEVSGKSRSAAHLCPRRGPTAVGGRWMGLVLGGEQSSPVSFTSLPTACTARGMPGAKTVCIARFTPVSHKKGECGFGVNFLKG